MSGTPRCDIQSAVSCRTERDCASEASRRNLGIETCERDFNAAGHSILLRLARGRTQPRSASRAFTLTDLLVIVAAITVLGAIAVTASVSAKNKSQLAQCTANLQQISRAVLGFCNDNGQTLPAAAPGGPAEIWWSYKEQVKRYAGLDGPSSANDKVFACPNDRGYTDPMPFHDTPRFGFNSYVYNGVTLPGIPNIAGWELSAVKQPERTLLVMEWSAHAPLSWHKSKTGRRNQPFYCDAQNVVAFTDGHASFSKIYYDGYNAAFTQDPISGYDYKYSGN